MGQVNQRPWDFGIIYAASGGNVLPVYVDAKGVTQSYVALVNAYTPMTTAVTGGYDTCVPWAGGATGLTLSCEFGFVGVSQYKLKLQCKRQDETNWKDLQIALQADPGTVAAEQVVNQAGMNHTLSLVYQTASVFTVQQIRIIAEYSVVVNEFGPQIGDYIVVRGEVG
jgi:hypothetical protein